MPTLLTSSILSATARSPGSISVASPAARCWASTGVSTPRGRVEVWPTMPCVSLNAPTGLMPSWTVRRSSGWMGWPAAIGRAATTTVCWGGWGAVRVAAARAVGSGFWLRTQAYPPRTSAASTSRAARILVRLNIRLPWNEK